MNTILKTLQRTTLAGALALATACGGGGGGSSSSEATPLAPPSPPAPPAASSSADLQAQSSVDFLSTDTLDFSYTLPANAGSRHISVCLPSSDPRQPDYNDCLLKTWVHTGQLPGNTLQIDLPLMAHIDELLIVELDADTLDSNSYRWVRSEGMTITL